MAAILQLEGEHPHDEGGPLVLLEVEHPYDEGDLFFYLIQSSLLRNSLWKTDKIVIFDIMEKGESSHFTGGKSVKRRGESWPK